MSNVKFETASQYYSGQGVLMLGVKNPVTLAIEGYEPVGNVSSLKISVSTSVVDHKGTQDGQRGIDKRLQTETAVKMSMVMESWTPSNIARALRGGFSKRSAAASTAQTLNAFPGRVATLNALRVSAVALTVAANPLVDFVAVGTPWDYRLNADAGSFMLNDGSVDEFSGLGTVITGITVGSTTTLTAANTATAGKRVRVRGVTGADAAVLNGQIFTVVSSSGAAMVIAYNSTGKTLTTSAGTKFLALDDLVSVSAVYDSAEQYQMEALTAPLTDVPVRFEGLNTASDNSPVVVEVFKFSSNPLQELALISDTLGMMDMEGVVLADNSVAPGTSKYFRVRKLIA